MNKNREKLLTKAVRGFIVAKQMVRYVAEAARCGWAIFCAKTINLIFVAQKIGGGGKFPFSILLENEYEYLKYLNSVLLNGLSGNVPVEHYLPQQYLILSEKYSSSAHHLRVPTEAVR